MKIDFDKNLFIIPPDAARGFGPLAVGQKKGSKIIGVLLALLLILAGSATFLLFKFNQELSNDPHVIYAAEDSSAAIGNEINIPEKEFPDLRDWGPYCDKNSQALITGLKGDDSSCNEEPKIKEGKYVDISLGKMLAILYNDGILAKELKVLTRGCRSSPSPKGNFKILSKHPLHFSSLFYVWMPWAMNIYGDYFLHGTPYYPDGKPVVTPCSAGCMRFDINEIQEIYNFAEVGTPVIIYE